MKTNGARYDDRAASRTRGVTGRELIKYNKCTAPEDTETINLPRWRTERRAHLPDLAELRDGFLGGGGPRRGPPSRSSAAREGRERGPLDGDTVGFFTYGDELKHNFTAHPKLCAESGELHFFGYGARALRSKRRSCSSGNGLLMTSRRV